MKQQGFNHNIRYKGVLFHVQTEDYGLSLHKVVTQLFYSGQILHKKITDYGDIIGQKDFVSKMKALMQDQHKQMLKELTQGSLEIPKQVFANAQHVSEKSK